MARRGCCTSRAASHAWRSCLRSRRWRSSGLAGRATTAWRSRTVSRAGLAASGITVVSGLAEGIPAAAHLGALDGGRAHGDGDGGRRERGPPRELARAAPAHRRGGLRAGGAAVRRAPGAAGATPPAARIVAALARLVIVVEATSTQLNCCPRGWPRPRARSSRRSPAARERSRRARPAPAAARGRAAGARPPGRAGRALQSG